MSIPANPADNPDDHSTLRVPRPAPRPGPRERDESGQAHPPRSAPPSSRPEPFQAFRPAQQAPPPSPPPVPPDAAAPPAGRQAWPTRIEPRAGGTGQQRAVAPEPAELAEPAQPARPATRPAGTPAGERAAPGDPDRAGEEQAPSEPPPGDTPQGESTGRPRRRRTIVLAVVLAVVLLATGGVLALPDVSNRLGLPWAPNLPQSDPPAPREVALALRAASGAGSQPTADGVAAALDPLVSDPAFTVLTGSVVDPASGTALWERDPGQARVPGSTTKLFTAAAALLALDHDMRIPTTVVEGAEPGTVVLVAGGDVTLSSLPPGQESIFPGAAHLDDLVEQVRDATGGDVSRVELDTSAFTGPTEGPGWAPEDVPSTYMVAVEPAMLDGGRTDPLNGHSPGRPDPAEHLAGVLASELGAQAGGATTAPEGAAVLGEVRSAPVSQLVRTSLVESDNLLAEALGRQVAIAEGKEPSFEGAAEATLDVLSRNGLDVGDVDLRDNSGLSPQSAVSAVALTRLLTMAASGDGEPRLRPMLGGMPVAGGSGTLAGRYGEGPTHDGRGWVRAKTGSLPGENGVHTLAGQVQTADGRLLVFALMGVGSDTDAVRAALDRFPAALHACGCR
ncbi:D-alanyl-D-alanine carboxypeptidase/D-alanyl-D-alanine-endopeptidase [Saccharomonospora piscinae]|nr:D-alanyl-D-alanine carboxypeptidase/D-alanyl-D-alanine-endopeptidase [Saccharomonospora piscinae]